MSCLFYDWEVHVLFFLITIVFRRTHGRRKVQYKMFMQRRQTRTKIAQTRPNTSIQRVLNDWRRGVGGIKAKTYDGEKAWSSIIFSILSASIQINSPSSVKFSLFAQKKKDVQRLLFLYSLAYFLWARFISKLRWLLKIFRFLAAFSKKPLTQPISSRLAFFCVY